MRGYRLAEINFMHSNFTDAVVHFRFNSVPDIAYMHVLQYKLFTRLLTYVSSQVATGHFCLTACRCLIRKGFVRPISYVASYLATASIVEANKEILKAVAEAKEPKRKRSYIKFTPEYKAKVAKFASINGNTA